ncbi:hypothetical protein G5I_12719 [Acromyrmex echinatior]|uniref:Uncharacterized protein n=1 Tax=Acromyrmex echinatior TaxID=103372 RepID=F4X328_ACREC|nr:hypothetical protein G5I_12719 [Acromyrmex echinatior]
MDLGGRYRRRNSRYLVGRRGGEEAESNFSSFEFLTAIAILSRTHWDIKSFPFDDEESAYPIVQWQAAKRFSPENREKEQTSITDLLHPNNPV